jgi:PAS domain S-box-containing protein
MPDPESVTAAPSPSDQRVDGGAVNPSPRVSEDGLRLLIEGVTDYAIFILDPTGHIASWNAGAERIKGYTEAEILGKHFSIFYLDEEKRRGKPAYELAVASVEGRFEDEGWRVRKDGTRFWANVVITALRDADGRLVAFGKVTRDLTERKRREEEATALAAAKAARTAAEHQAARMEEILHVIAHDVRQPLTALTGQAQLLSRALRRERYEQALSSAEAIAGLSRRIDTLLTDLVESARLESGRVRLDMREVALGEFLRELLQRFAATIPAERVRLEVPDATVLADPAHLERIVMNLLANALKYSPPETPVLVRVEERPEEIILSVADEGIGIAPRDLPRVFERGFRTPEAQTRDEGSGLGLFIVRELVQAHHGRIWLESEPNQGSTFFVALPRPAA